MNVMKRAVVGSKLLATLLGAMVVVSFAARAHAQIFQTEVRADDGTAYQIIHTQPTATGAEFIRITSLAGSSTGIGDCNNSQGMSGGLAQAIAGPAPPLQSLHPYFQILRTGILTPNDLTFNFDSSFGGRVTLGSGPGALNICEHMFDCNGQSNIQSVVTLDQNFGSIPAACIANSISAGQECDQNTTRNVFGFGLPATGSPPVCNDVVNPTPTPNGPPAVTANARICDPAPTDGFSLANGQFLVVIYDSTLAGLGFSVGSAGFGIDTDNDNPPNCAPGEIVSAQAASQSLPAPPLPSHTPSNTPTNTPTNTFTQTPTRTPTNTSTPTLSPTPTSTVTNTVTPSNTPTLTATRTETPSPTATATQTPTRPPIPVVPSPTSPAGLAMIGGLSIGLLWALRRLARTGA